MNTAAAKKIDTPDHCFHSLNKSLRLGNLPLFLTTEPIFNDFSTETRWSSLRRSELLWSWAIPIIVTLVVFALMVILVSNKEGSLDFPPLSIGFVGNAVLFFFIRRFCLEIADDYSYYRDFVRECHKLRILLNLTGPEFNKISQAELEKVAERKLEALGIELAQELGSKDLIRKMMLIINMGSIFRLPRSSSWNPGDFVQAAAERNTAG